MKRTPVTEQDPKIRATNFKEVCLGYNEEEAIKEANRCLNCKNPKCVEGCPCQGRLLQYRAAHNGPSFRG